MDYLEKIGLEWEKVWNALQGVDFRYLLSPNYLILGAVVALLVLFLIYLRRRPPKRIRAFRGDTGPVEVSRHALLELVHATCAELPEVRKPSVRVRARGGLRLTVRIQVDGSARLRDTAAHLQSLLKESLEANLGVERLRSIEVLVTGIRRRGRASVDLNPAPAPEPSPPPAPAPAPPRPAAPVVPPPEPEPEPEEAPRAREDSGEPAPPAEPEPSAESPAPPPEEDVHEPGEDGEEPEESEEDGEGKDAAEGTSRESGYPSPAAEAPHRRRRFWKRKS